MAGVLNARIDFLAFNMLISLTGLDRGISIAMFKSAWFLAAFCQQLRLNRMWTFDGEATSSWSGPESRPAIFEVVHGRRSRGITIS